MNRHGINEIQSIIYTVTTTNSFGYVSKLLFFEFKLTGRKVSGYDYCMVYDRHNSNIANYGNRTNHYPIHRDCPNDDTDNDYSGCSYDICDNS